MNSCQQKVEGEAWMKIRDANMQKTTQKKHIWSFIAQHGGHILHFRTSKRVNFKHFHQKEKMR